MQKQIVAGLIGLVLIISMLPGILADQGSDDSGSDDSDSRSDSLLTANGSINISDDESDTFDDSDDRSDKERVENRERRGVLGDVRKNLSREGKMAFGNMLNATNHTRRDFQEHRREVLGAIKERREEMRTDRKEFMDRVKLELKANADRIKVLRDSYDDEKKAYAQARVKLNRTCDKNASEDCKKARQDLNHGTREFMGNAAERMIRIIDNLERRVEAHPNIDNETAADVIAKLEVHKTAINAAQAKINNLSNSSDMNASKAAVADLRAAWVEARVTIKLTEGLLAHARFEEFLNHLARMETRFKEARDKLAAEGKNVTQLDADIASFGAKIDVAAAAYSDVEKAYVSAMATTTTEAQADELLKSSKAKLKATQEELKDARQDLRAILKDLKEHSTQVLAEIAAFVSADAQASATLEAEVEA